MMRKNQEGFVYPEADLEKCIQCGRCAKICPILTPISLNPCDTDSVYAAWHLDCDIRHDSSSGGVFTAIAEDILEKGGCVVGSAYDVNLMPEHIIVDTPNSLFKLRGSKYAQSRITASLYHDIERLLKDGKNVLCVGTPCQIAGMQAFFLDKPSRPFFIDLICHGVPSPLFLQEYLKSEKKTDDTVNNILFRSKETGWQKYSVKIYFKDGHSESQKLTSNPYMLAFLKNYCFRSSCYRCRFTQLSRPGDITLADFWGVKSVYPDYDKNDEGTSLVIINSERGKKLFVKDKIFYGCADLKTAISGNHALVHPPLYPIERYFFYKDLIKMDWNKLVKKYNLIALTGLNKYRILPRRFMSKLWKLGQRALLAIRDN